MGINISKVSIVQNAPAPAVIPASAPQPITIRQAPPPGQATPLPAAAPQAAQIQAPAMQAGAQLTADQAQKKPADKTTADRAKKYYTANDLKTATGMSGDILKLNDDLRNIAKQSFQYQTDIDEIKKEIGNDNGDPGKLERDTAELSGLKARLEDADTERMRKLNEVRAKYAEGNYRVNSRDIVDSWD